VQDSQFHIRHERIGSNHYSSVACEYPNQDKLVEVENLEATDRKKVVKHLNLNSLTMSKNNTAKGIYKMHNNDSEEEEMTQMSCGMNLRETFQEVSESNH